jgi:CDP-paratose 2-epimerase
VKILISGICGFVGATLATALRPHHEVFGFDNFVRSGSELNRRRLAAAGIPVLHADARHSHDIAALPAADWVIDSAALPSVLAGVDGRSSSRQVVEHNLGGTVNLLEYCRRHGAGFILLSTSRVYSIHALCALPLRSRSGAYHLDDSQPLPGGVSSIGVAETFPTTAPISLYGATKLASETLALEYSATFDFPVWINRCGVLAGAGQFGKADQGIFSYWIHAWHSRHPLRYLGFDGTGAQVRDALHPRDLVPLLSRQMSGALANQPRIVNVAGGADHAMSLAQLSEWCTHRFGAREVLADATPRQFDVPWLVLDSSLAKSAFDWSPAMPLEQILSEIASHAEAHPAWLDHCGT